MERFLPKPAVGWEPVYELLRCIGDVSDDPSVRAVHALALISGMQAGDSIDEWLLTELLSLAALDVDDPVCREAVGAPAGVFQGAGVLSVDWRRTSLLKREATSRSLIAEGRRNRNVYRDQVRSEMLAVEDGIQRALHSIEDLDDEEW
ncbi:MAG TPA: hypothetical protein VE754_01875 [Actinomycetota bacterium]|nr:hypothetical protein [Actinomycetota bacterium]